MVCVAMILALLREGPSTAINVAATPAQLEEARKPPALPAGSAQTREGEDLGVLERVSLKSTSVRLEYYRELRPEEPASAPPPWIAPMGRPPE
jgi:hypothetical protein